jgi:Zn-dependent M28 family amino/carboxypeptidase
VVSSHYDSVAIGPGADDDSSGTAALLETARLLANHPQPATIVFASFTGEEAGLLGSREFVRRAVADKVQIVGALNNDMIGWSNDYRLDNTIRYSNAGIRDIQHAAAMQFSKLITYDALYYKSTDAAAYYEAYGDIVGGIGSYPVLGNPHYHQSHDLLEGINHQLVTEVAKTTTATLMLLASSPSRIKDLKIESLKNGTASLSWAPSPEKGITGYLVAFGPSNKPEAQQIRVTRPTASVAGMSPGMVVSVKAVNAKGLEGWDWARVTVR